MAKIVTTLPEAKARARRAYQAARAGDNISAALYDRIYATALSSAAGQPEAIAAAMFARAAICLEVLADMRGWPTGVVAGLTAPRQGSRLHVS
jgi:hypothetical protein